MSTQEMADIRARAVEARARLDHGKLLHHDFLSHALEDVEYLLEVVGNPGMVTSVSGRSRAGLAQDE